MKPPNVTCIRVAQIAVIGLLTVGVDILRPLYLEPDGFSSSR
jgi:hypothetical protein